MKVIKKQFDNLPQHWQDFIRERNWFESGQFYYDVSIQFEDGSQCYFRYAFLVEDAKRKEVAVFTEHCGYYIFQIGSLNMYARLKHEPSIVGDPVRGSDDW